MEKRTGSIAGAVGIAALVVGPWACSASRGADGFADAGGSSGGSSGGASPGDGGPGYGGFGDGNSPPPQYGDGGCTNLQCQVHACSGGGSTEITGEVMDPAGRNPLYNVLVYIPNSKDGALDPIPVGISSDSCNCGSLFSGQPMAYALTAANGAFTIKNAPDGANIPLVVQIGKWRKEIAIPNVSSCKTNDVGIISLPKNHTDGMYASIPNIAVSTGGADTLECLLTRVGVDEGEFSGDPNDANARVHVFQGVGGNAASGSPKSSSAGGLWDTDQDIDRYDITLLSCEGAPTMGPNAQAIADYVGNGGRVFAEHYHYAFFANQPQFANTADWSQTQMPDVYPTFIQGVVQTTLPSGNPFPEGQALQTWLTTVGALPGGQLLIDISRHDALVGPGNLSAVWVQAAPGTSPMSSQYFSWDMPFNAPTDDAGVPQYCGRVVYSDLHVSGTAADYSNGNMAVPSGCDATSVLSADEDAIEFILFDLSSCITPVGYTPMAPPNVQ